MPTPEPLELTLPAQITTSECTDFLAGRRRVRRVLQPGALAAGGRARCQQQPLATGASCRAESWQTPGGYPAIAPRPCLYLHELGYRIV